MSAHQLRFREVGYGCECRFNFPTLRVFFYRCCIAAHPKGAVPCIVHCLLRALLFSMMTDPSHQEGDLDCLSTGELDSLELLLDMMQEVEGLVSPTGMSVSLALFFGDTTLDLLRDQNLKGSLGRQPQSFKHH
jgi:hypothetical protein